MPRFDFNVLDDAARLPDDEGLDRPGFDDARRYAIDAARELVSEWARLGERPLSWAFTVTDASGAVLFTVPFKDAVTVR
jgi:hypothetical protein